MFLTEPVALCTSQGSGSPAWLGLKVAGDPGGESEADGV